MQKNTFLAFILFVVAFNSLNAQTNIISTNPLAEQILKGNYNPADYASSIPVTDPDSIVQSLNNNISADSLKSYLFKLSSFKNRNTGSDTLSSTIGIGAARQWVYSKFSEISTNNENRLIPSYLQFNLSICGITKHKNIYAVLPGTDTTDKSIIIMEAHIDSRCAVLCDTACFAEGMEDNASGTALVLELARVMSKNNYSRSIAFVITIGEEQGLYGAGALADYCKAKGIKIRAVLNNDVIGGIICGKTSSTPSCPGYNHIDSTQVRLFSFGGFNSFNKAFARFTKLQYKEELRPFVKVPMLVSIMSAEDRTGRGGDHIPFRQQGYTAIRFTSANEHGDASNGTGYTDRQHTTSDILGVDTDSDMIIDSFFVDFNYLARNAAINGVSATMAATSTKTPDFTASYLAGDTLKVKITVQNLYQHYRIGLRTTSNDWDTVYTFTGSDSAKVKLPVAANYYVSTASVDSNGIESLFSKELLVKPIATGIAEPAYRKGIKLLQNVPNPADEATIISVMISNPVAYKEAHIRITDLSGKLIKTLPVNLKNEINEVLYEHGYNASGIFIYTIVVDGKELGSKRMEFTN